MGRERETHTERGEKLKELRIQVTNRRRSSKVFINSHRSLVPVLFRSVQYEQNFLTSLRIISSDIPFASHSCTIVSLLASFVKKSLKICAGVGVSDNATTLSLGLITTNSLILVFFSFLLFLLVSVCCTVCCPSAVPSAVLSN